MNALALTVALPLLAAFLLPTTARLSGALARLLGPLTLGVMALLILQVWVGLGDVPGTLWLGGFAPPLGIVFYADGVALTFALAVPVLALLLWPRDGEGLQRRQGLTLLLAAASCGLALSGDLFNLYVFYELAAVASYGLVTDRGRAAGYAAAFRYLLLSAFGSVLALLGIGLIYFTTGTLNLAQLASLQGELAGPVGLTAFFLLLLGFGVKAEIFPLNGWVPEVYSTASRRVTGLLAGLVSKLALLVVMRLLVLVFPLPEAYQALLLLGLLGVLAGELAAWRAPDLARTLAWSSIGQLGLIFVAFSVPGEAGVMAGIALALHHLVVKPGLFLLAERWGGALSGLQGAGRRAPLAGALFVVFALSLIGVPPLPGFWAKFLLFGALADVSSGWALFAMVLIGLATVIEANYLFRIVNRLYQRPGTGPAVGDHRLSDLGIAAVCGGVLLATVLWLTPLATGLDQLAASAADAELYIETVLNPVPGQGQGE